MGLYERLCHLYETTNLLTKRTQGEFEIFCYSKEAFFGGEWTEDLLRARGLIFYKGRLINSPFRKIFNLGEVPDTAPEVVARLIQTYHHFEVMDKSNGHLFIISAFWNDEGAVDFIYSTKGSLPHEKNELLMDDLRIFDRKFKRKVEDAVTIEMESSQAYVLTIMCEALVEHDKHALYDQQTKQYGENTFVMLGCNMASEYAEVEVGREYLEYFSAVCGLPCIQFHDDSSITDRVKGSEWDSLKDDVDIEGYVIWFPRTGFRVKIKTREYWKLRFKADLTVERVLRMYRAGGEDRLRLRLPEEVAERFLKVILKYHRIYHEHCLVGWGSLSDTMRKLTGRTLFAEETLTNEQKVFIHDPAGILQSLPRSVAYREAFVEGIYKEPSLLRDFETEIRNIVDEL